MERYIGALITLEYFLNLIGYFPVAGTISGLLRIVLALGYQMLTGLFCVLLGLLAAMVTWALRSRAASRRCIALAQFGKRQQVHASLNFWRGTLELIPILGGLTLFIYDRTMKGEQLIDY